MSTTQNAKLAAMLVKGATINALAEGSGLCRQTVSTFVDSLRAEGAVHVARYATDTTGRKVVPVHKLGRRPDKIKPDPLTPAEKQKAYRDRLKKARKS